MKKVKIFLASSIEDLRKNTGKAEESFDKDMEFARHMAAGNTGDYEANLAKRYVTQGMLYIHPQYYGKAVEAFGKAVEIYTRLAEQSPEVYGPKQSDALWNLIELYELQNNTEKLEAVCRSAQPLFEKLAQEFPERYRERAEHIQGILLPG